MKILNRNLGLVILDNNLNLSTNVFIPENENIGYIITYLTGVRLFIHAQKQLPPPKCKYVFTESVF